jgi:hypothetical protein
VTVTAARALSLDMSDHRPGRTAAESEFWGPGRHGLCQCGPRPTRRLTPLLNTDSGGIIRVIIASAVIPALTDASLSAALAPAARPGGRRRSDGSAAAAGGRPSRPARRGPGVPPWHHAASGRVTDRGQSAS